MIERIAKASLVAAVALFYTLVVFNNTTDFGSNYQFVRHVLSMDSTFAGNRGLWRALPWPGFHLAFYLSIIAWELVTCALLWAGVFQLCRALRGPAASFHLAKRTAVFALTLSLLMWLVAFIDVGGEWFLMWQSHIWNGEEAAFRMFAVAGIVLLILLRPELEGRP